MKTVFNNRQLAHVWVSQTQSEGRNPSRTMYFRGNEIYSYGSHYLMAKLHKTRSGETIALVNEYNYSNTTAKQRRDVCSALYKKYNSLAVPRPDILKCEENENYLFNQVIEYINSMMSSRVSRVSFNYLSNLIDDLNFYLKSIGKKSFSLDPELHGVLIEVNIEREKKNKERDAKRETKRILETEKMRLDQESKVQAWFNGGPNSGISWYLFKDIYKTDLIRLKPGSSDIIETNRGAEVPLSHAIRLMARVLSNEVKSGDQVGHFKVDNVETSGILKIGCHEISVDQAKTVLMPLMAKGE